MTTKSYNDIEPSNSIANTHIIINGQGIPDGTEVANLEVTYYVKSLGFQRGA